MRVQLPPLQPFMLRVAQEVRAPGCGPGGRRFETGHAPHGFLAQLVERQTEDLRVPGSIPGEPTIYLFWEKRLVSVRRFFHLTGGITEQSPFYWTVFVLSL